MADAGGCAWTTGLAVRVEAERWCRRCPGLFLVRGELGAVRGRSWVRG